MDEINEKKLEEALKRGTDEAVEMKNQVWTNIEKNLDSKEVKNKTMKKRSGIFKYGSIAAALLAAVLVTNPRYVNAAVDTIKDLFAPTKTIEQSLEGTNENTQLDLEISSQKYVIYIDKAIYELKTIDGKDIIAPKQKAEGYPEVSMTIEQVAKKPAEAAADIEKGLKSKFKEVKKLEEVTDPVKGLSIRALSGNTAKDTVVNYYIVDNTKGGSFIIKQQYFLEAAEGHGARFYHMLKEFKVVTE